MKRRPTARSAAILGAWVLASCAGSAPGYTSFAELRYPFEAERTLWSPRAKLELRVAELGPPAAGPIPLVLLHPWGLNMSVWTDVAPRLAEDRRVLLVDLPGHGKSDKTHTAMPMKRLAASVLDAMTAAGIDRAYVAGNSLGGATAVAIADLAPERVEGLILIASPGGGALPVQLRRLAKMVATPDALQTLSAEAWWVGMAIAERSDRPLARKLRKDVIALRSAAEFEAWCRASVAVLRSVAEYTPTLEGIEAPAVVIHGEGDPLISRRLNGAMADRLPNAELVVLKGCGHLPEVECPERLVLAIEAFLRRTVATGAGK